MWTYIEVGIILSLMILSKSKFVYLPSIVIFILGGSLSSVPNFKSFSFIFACIVVVCLVGCIGYFVYYKRKGIAYISVSNYFVITTILLAFGMLLSTITSIKPLITLAAIGGFLVNLILMYLVLTSIKVDDNSKEKLAQSFVAIFM